MPASKGRAELAVPPDSTATTHASNLHQQKGQAAGAEGPSCQIPACNADLWKAEEYHRRCRICEEHLIADHIIIEGAGVRFCQQCEVIHPVSSFEGDGRSCVAPQRQQRGKRQRSEEVSINGYETYHCACNCSTATALANHGTRECSGASVTSIICASVTSIISAATSCLMHGAASPQGAVEADA